MKDWNEDWEEEDPDDLEVGDRVVVSKMSQKPDLFGEKGTIIGILNYWRHYNSFGRLIVVEFDEKILNGHSGYEVGLETTTWKVNPINKLPVSSIIGKFGHCWNFTDTGPTNKSFLKKI